MINRFWQNDKFRYLAIGGYNTVFGYGVFAALWVYWGYALHYVGVLIISHFISVINAFFAYRILVFRKKGGVWSEFAKFNAVYIGVFVFNLITLPILIEGLNVHPLVAQALLVVITVVSSYVLHRRYTFK